MTLARKRADTRKKELQLAIFRIEQGRAHTKEKKLSISAVAREAGVTPALIHNHYPSIADAIRAKLNKLARGEHNERNKIIKDLQEKNRTLREEIDDMRLKISRLASINESLLTENRILVAKISSPNVVDIAPPTTKK